MFRRFCFVAVLAWAWGQGLSSQDLTPPTDTIVDFARDIDPILRTYCYGCHGPTVQMHGLRLDNRPGALSGGESGSPALLPGNSAESRLVAYVAGLDPDVVMPPSGERLIEEQIALLRAWIDQGAQYSKQESGTVAQKHQPGSNHWSFRAIVRPPVPIVENASWVRNPIDAFVLQKLEARGWKPSPPAEPHSLLRRMYLDLIGLPPTLEEQDALLRDPSPKHFDRLVSDLLARPGYGERWGRHWLDLVRYAESNGYERDATKPDVWKYRDYVIRSFNQDKPYDRFVLEQLAGDELPNVSAETLIALGYTRLGPWDDEPADFEQDRFDQLDDIVRTTSEVFLGVTLGCARCHDHKFDPLTQRDYYSMAATFNGLQRHQNGKRELSLPVGNKEELDRLAARDAEIEPLEKRIANLRDSFRVQFLESGESKLPSQAIEAFLAEEKRRTDAQEELIEEYRAQLAQEVSATLPSDIIAEIARIDREIVSLREAVPDLPRGYFLHEPQPLPGPMHLLLRGRASSPGPQVPPGVPAVLVKSQPALPKPQRTSFRRLTLARWLVSRENPLTPRVIVNRVWQFHFGEGLVRTPSDFGTMGEKPTHPELLDWLATRFMDDGWSLKRLHYLIMTSNTYRMSKAWNQQYGEQDPETRLLWRVPYTRLQVEAIRDSMLAVSGKLNRKMFGPSMLPEIPKGALEGHSDPDTIWQPSEAAEASRRTVYSFIKRTMIIPMLEVLDFCDTTRSSAERAVTSVAPQALTLFNGKFVNLQARFFAQRLMQEAGPGFEEQVDRAYLLALSRHPSPGELTSVLDFLHRETEAVLWEEGSGIGDRPGARRRALEQACRAIFNLNEFVYAD